MLERKRIIRAPMEAITGNQEIDLVIASLRGIEQREGERRGWDLPPRLYTLHRLHPDLEALEARIIPRRDWHPRDGFAVDHLETYAIKVVKSLAPQQLDTPPAELQPLSFNDTPDGIAAVAMLHEGWKVDHDHITHEEQRRRAAGERVLQNNPHRTEVRIVVACDINGNSYYIERAKGETTTGVRAKTLTGEQLDRRPSAEHDKTFDGLSPSCVLALGLAARTGHWPPR